MAKRNLTVKLEKTSGTFERIIVWANDYPIVFTDGQNGQWTGRIPDGKVKIETAVWGHGKSSYTLTLDLPGTLADQKIECVLTKGYYDAEYTI